MLRIEKRKEKIMKKLKVRLTFTEDILGTSSANPEIHREFICSKSPNAETIEDEVAAIGAEEVFEKGMTIFPKENGNPFIYDYQIKGFFKDACSMLRKVPKSESGKIKAYKKEIDGLIFVDKRKIPIHASGETTICQRPLRGSTPQGEKIALASSESIPAGSYIEFTVTCLVDAHLPVIIEWLDYGKLRGLGQWRNSGKGKFSWQEITEA